MKEWVARRFLGKYGVWCGVVCVGMMSLPESARADRRTSLQSNRIIEDADDLFIYPHLAYDYRNRLALDYAPGSGAGSGLFLIDNETFAWGFALQRGALFDVTSLTGQTELAALGAIENPMLAGGDAGAIDPLVAADLFIAGKNAGVRLSVGMNREPVSGAVSETIDRARFINLATSFELDKDWDVGLHLGAINSIQRELLTITDRTTQVRGSAIVRKYIERSKTRDLGLLIRTGYVFQRYDTLVGDVSTGVTSGQFDIGLGMGPRVKIRDQVQVAAYGVLNYQSSSARAESVEEQRQDFLLPGFNVAAEATLRPWLRVRGGMEYTLVARSPGEELIPATYDDALLWSAGVGFVHHNFDLNVTLASRPPVAFELPDPVDPMDPSVDAEEGLGALFGGVPTLMVSSVYRFGDSRYHEMKPTEELYPEEPQPVQPIYQVVPAPAAQEGNGVIQPPAARPAVNHNASQQDASSEEPSGTSQTSATPKTEGTKKKATKKDGQMMGTPPPPGSDNLFVPVNP